MAKKKKRKAAPGDIATNRQASFRFNLIDRFEAGIVLQGSEVKSLREGGVQLKDAYAEVRDGEVWLRNMHIAPYKPARDNHDPERPRKLLLHRREIERLLGATSEKGLTAQPAIAPHAAARIRSRPSRRRMLIDQSSPRSAAQRVSSWRLESWSFRNTEETCASTVFGEISSRRAISLYM